MLSDKLFRKATNECGSMDNFYESFEINPIRLVRYFMKGKCKEQFNLVLNYLSNRPIDRNIIDIYKMKDVIEKGKSVAVLPLCSLITSPDTRPSTSPDTRPSTSPNTRPSTSPDTRPSISPDTRPSTSPDTRPSTSPDTNTEDDCGPIKIEYRSEKINVHKDSTIKDQDVTNKLEYKLELEKLSRRRVASYLKKNNIHLIVVVDKSQLKDINIMTDLPYIKNVSIVTSSNIDLSYSTQHTLDTILGYLVLSDINVFITHQVSTFLKVETLPIFEYMEVVDHDIHTPTPSDEKPKPNTRVGTSSQEHVKLLPTKKRVEKLLVNIPIDMYEDKVLTCQPKELIEMYSIVKEYMNFSDTDLVKLYGINLLNLVRWSKGVENLEYVADCVRHYLVCCVEGYVPIPQGLIKVIENIYEDIDDVLELIRQRDPKMIIVIDGDNVKPKIKKISGVMSIVVLKNGKKKWEDKNCTYLHSRTDDKDAADISACVLMSKISALYPSIKLKIITKDHFARELSLCIKCEYSMGQSGFY